VHVIRNNGGPPKNKPTDPPVHLLHPRPNHPPSDFVFFLRFVFVLERFWAFLGKGRSKTPKNIKILLQKFNVENFSQKKTTKKSMSVFPRLFFGFVAFSGVSSRREFKNTTKNRPKIQNRFFLGFLFVTFLGVSR
jgi:hypothetical protein